MKKLASALSVLAFLATMTFGFSSCQQQNQPEQPKSDETTKTDETTKQEEASIIGEWKLLYTEAAGEVIPVTDADPAMKMTFTFFENGTCLMAQGGDAYSYKGTYTLAGKTLIMEVAGDVMKWTIKELSKDMLVLSMTMEGESADYTFKRV